MILKNNDMQRLVRGASILTTGGGLCLKDQLISLEKHHNNSVHLNDLATFGEDDVLVTASEVGLADAKEMEKKDVLPKMIQVWEKISGRKISGVYAAEIGQESIIIDTAVGLGVPIVDFDVAGGRAVPFVDINTMRVAGIEYSLAPLVVATNQGDIISVDTKMSFNDTEALLRSLSGISNSGIAYFIGGAIRAGDICNHGIANKSLSLAFALGSASNAEEIRDKLQPRKILSGCVVNKKEVEISGFNCFEACFQDKAGNTYKLFIMNELLFVTDNYGCILATPPDKIFILDENKMVGVSSKDLLGGREVSLYLVDADTIWKSKNGLDIFGRNRFSELGLSL
jgi:DUF917 family protein